MGDNEHSEEYKKYINSSAWRMKRALALHAGGYKCARCGATRGLQVHHKHYDTLGHERACDLEVLCPSCHQKADGQRAFDTQMRGLAALEEARFDGWASKVYGSNYIDTEDKRARFEDWLERQGDDW